MALSTTAALFPYAGAMRRRCLHAQRAPAVDSSAFTNAHITPAKVATVPLEKKVFLFLIRF